MSFTASTEHILMQSSGNFLNFSIPTNGPILYACGVTLNGTRTEITPSVTPSTTSSPSTSSTGSITPSVTPTPSVSPTTISDGIDWWIIVIGLVIFVAVLTALIIGAGIMFYHWKSKKLNQYAIMN